MNSGFSDASSGSRTVSASGTDCSAAGSAAFPATGSDGVVSSMENSDSGSETTGPDSVKTFCLYDADFIVLIVVIFFKELGSESSGSLLFVN